MISASYTTSCNLTTEVLTPQQVSFPVNVCGTKAKVLGIAELEELAFGIFAITKANVQEIKRKTLIPAL